MRNYLFSNGEVKNKQADVFRQPENKIEGKWRLRRSSCLGQITVDQWKRRDRNDVNSPLVLRSSRYAYLNTPVSVRPVKILCVHELKVHLQSIVLYGKASFILVTTSRKLLPLKNQMILIAPTIGCISPLSEKKFWGCRNILLR